MSEVTMDQSGPLTSLPDDLSQDSKLKSKLQEALGWSVIGEAGYWQISYDPQAGTCMNVTVGPDGKPITDEELRQIYLDELSQRGVDTSIFERQIYMGDIRVDV